MDQAEIIFLLAAFAAGTAAGCFRAGRDGDYRGVFDLLCVGAVAGVLGLFVAAAGFFYARGWIGFGIACAAGVGVLGRAVVDKIIDGLVENVRTLLNATTGFAIERIKKMLGSDDKGNDEPGK